MARATRSRRAPRRKTARRKMSMRRRLPLSSQRKVYSFRRTCEIRPWLYFDGQWTRQTDNRIGNNNALTNNTGIFKFALTDLPGYTDFVNLYENYKLTGVKLRFIPIIGTESSANVANNAIMSPVAMCIDRGANDLIPLNPTFIELLEHQDVMLRSSYKPFSLYIRYPKAHSGADALTQTVLTSPWLDLQVNGESVDHHGLKYCFQDVVAADRAVSYRVYATYYIKCRGPQ